MDDNVIKLHSQKQPGTEKSRTGDDWIGPNGGRMEFAENGDMVEYVTEEDGTETALIFERGFESKYDAIEELTAILERLEAKYPSDSATPPPPHIAYHRGLIMGRRDALDWTLGLDWMEPAPQLAPEHTAYDAKWYALIEGKLLKEDQTVVQMSVKDCGEVHIDSGQLLICDPCLLQGGEDSGFKILKGKYPVKVTIADGRVAYATVVISSELETARREISSVCVDSGTVCFTDCEAIQQDMPADPAAFEVEFQSWIERKGNSNHANIPLPGGSGSTNIVITSTAFGDGIYPVVGGFAQDKLVAVHLDFTAPMGTAYLLHDIVDDQERTNHYGN